MATTGRPGPDAEEAGQPRPGYRDSLANERTFLAWTRTSLALTAGSVAVVQLIPRMPDPDLRWIAATFLALVAGGTAVLAYTRWRATELAMREGRPRPPAAGLAAVTVAITVLAVAALVLAVTDRR